MLSKNTHLTSTQKLGYFRIYFWHTLYLFDLALFTYFCFPNNISHNLGVRGDIMNYTLIPKMGLKKYVRPSGAIAENSSYSRRI